MNKRQLRRIIKEETKKLLSERIKYSDYSAQVTLPMVVHADDYHRFESLQKILNALLQRADVKYEEMGMSGRDYAAIFYDVGEYPQDTDEQAMEEMYSQKMTQLAKYVL